jgi:hypothetical protein
MSLFKDHDEFRNVFDELFGMLSKDPEIGPRLRATRTPQRFVFTDLDLTLNVRDSDDRRAARGLNLIHVWGACKWEPVVTMEMTSDVANRYFQGRENVPVALARRVIVLRTGDLSKVLDLLPVVQPFHKKWVARLKASGRTHLIA